MVLILSPNVQQQQLSDIHCPTDCLMTTTVQSINTVNKCSRTTVWQQLSDNNCLTTTVWQQLSENKCLTKTVFLTKLFNDNYLTTTVLTIIVQRQLSNNICCLDNITIGCTTFVVWTTVGQQLLDNSCWLDNKCLSDNNCQLGATPNVQCKKRWR